MNAWENKAVGALAGSAVGDALGGATEGWTPEQIQQRYGGPVMGIVGPYYQDWRTARPIAPYHKGDGHITDDTLMTHALVNVYERVQRHLTAFDMAEHLVPQMLGDLQWIPELEAEALLLQRVFLAEKYLVHRLHYAHVDPRDAGVGNIVNCGAAMYCAPVGVANAADPVGAYAEAVDLASAHQSSFGVEAAGVLAAAVAAAMTPGASADQVVSAALQVAKDGTKSAIEAVAAVAVPGQDFVAAAPILRAAIAPFDTVGEVYRSPDLDARRPSRTKAIEELPVALGFLLVSGGDYRQAVLGAVNYGRDADSIASMVGAICGAMGGAEAVPEEWREQVSQASRTDITAPGIVMAKVAARIAAQDAEAMARRLDAIGPLRESMVNAVQQNGFGQGDGA